MRHAPSELGRLAAALLFAGLILHPARSATQSQSAPAAPVSDSTPTSVQMRNVNFHVGGDVVMQVRRLTGLMKGVKGVVDFDDPSSFTTWVSAADVALDGENLARLLNNHVFAYRGAPLRKLKIELRDGLLWQSGILHKGVDIPFRIKAQVSATPDGRIKLHPVDTRIFGVDGDKLMKALGLTMQKMVNVSKATGVSIQKNDFFLDPIRILPPPEIRGRLISVRVENGLLVQEIGADPTGGPRFAGQWPVPPDTTVTNYMYYRGGHLHFSRKLLMSDADMQVIDADPATPFDFNLARYMVQLKAGYSRTIGDGGLWVLMPDANHVVRLEQSVGGDVTSNRGAGAPSAPSGKPDKP
jgi:hypothetical protein